MAAPETISVPEFKERIRSEGTLKDFLLKLHREGKKIRVEITPQELDQMPSSSDLLFGRYIIPIYRGGDLGLYSANPGGRRPQISGLGYKNASAARRTVKKVAGKSRKYQKQALGTMFYRAKHHARRTRGMKNAMGIFKKRLANIGMDV